MIALGGMIVSQSLRVGGYDFDDAIASYLKRVHGVVVGQPTAEKLKLAVGSAMPLQQELESEVRGREVASGPAEDRPPHERRAAHRMRRAAAGDRRRRESHARAHAAGAGRGHLDPRHPARRRGCVAARAGRPAFMSERELPVRLADSPLTCVVIGAGQALEEFDAMEELDGRPTRRRLRARAARRSRASEGASARDDRVRDRGRGLPPRRPLVRPHVRRAGPAPRTIASGPWHRWPPTTGASRWRRTR